MSPLFFVRLMAVAVAIVVTVFAAINWSVGKPVPAAGFFFLSISLVCASVGALAGSAKADE